MRRFIVALAFLCAPSVVAQAQVEYQWADFVRTASGFNTTLLFRNTNQYGDPTIVSIGEQLMITGSARLATYCAPMAIECHVNKTGAQLQTRGAVQGTMTIGNYTFFSRLLYSEDSSPLDCLPQLYDARPSFGVLGCQIPLLLSTPPTAPGRDDFFGRTCDGDGFTGWLALPLVFNISRFSGPSLPPHPDYDTSDLIPTFSTRVINAAVVTPEPGTWGLMLVGLVGLGVAGRRKRSH